ncbi:DUF1194 domain-containing protein [Roseovarius atlanticus]|uniref:DUF1194 domain-containing protein n=1 Tax=Roseovarius atlanticus TaxID=1641875 RepID=UPI001C93B21D|nr:DUF1194 domain-containing protein [Roseovarius atlanticus]MBY5989343.1 DUF1194 domain-containing protein [Roseovarius atlanticus]MBY6124735.1 DUF1194 domain-containing protein [Roseovarius atlanticus]MBY6149230.1 DUF1194 domain-containing protein [Roseovarius atlanticus]
MSLRALAVCCIAMWAGVAQAECRQALALGLDVSGSVDAGEYRLQTDGLAAALLAPEVQEAFLAVPEAPVRLMIYEWSGVRDQRVLLDWTEIDGAARLAEVAARLRATQKARGDDPTTAISAAILVGVAALNRQADCLRRTLDISGDGPANIGLHPRELTEEDLGDVTVNGLVIGPQSRSNTSKNLHNVKSLEGYFRAFVLHGPGAFAETARDHADFAAAMRRKLVRELQLPNLSRLVPPQPAGLRLP